MKHGAGLMRVGNMLGLMALVLILLQGSSRMVFAQSNEGFEVDGPCAMTRAAQLPIEFEYFGTIPTGFDGP